MKRLTFVMGIPTKRLDGFVEVIRPMFGVGEPVAKLLNHTFEIRNFAV